MHHLQKAAATAPETDPAMPLAATLCKFFSRENGPESKRLRQSNRYQMELEAHRNRYKQKKVNPVEAHCVAASEVYANGLEDWIRVPAMLPYAAPQTPRCQL